MKKTGIEKKLDRLLTVVIVILAVVCLSLCVKTMQGRDASILGFRIYHILTGSMEPTIPVGSNVLVKEVDPYSLEVGDVITFISKDQAIYGNANTHRIIAIEKDESGKRLFVTKGDANNTSDSLYVYPQDVKGKVIFHMNSSSFTMFYQFVKTPQGFVTVIMLPLVLVSWCVLKDFKYQVNEMMAQNAARELEEEKKKSGNADNIKAEDKLEG